MSIELYTEASGDGPLLVGLHGFGASTYTWRAIAPELARRHRVLLVDLQGCGRSPKPRNADYSVFAQADLVRALIRHHGRGGVSLVGHSYGGGVALATAVADTDGLIDRLVLIDTIAYRQRLPWFIRLLRMPVVGSAVPWLVPPRLQVRLVLAQAYHDARKISAATVAAYARGLASAGGRQAMTRTARELIPAGIDAFAARYPSLGMPILLIAGEHDRFVPREVAVKLHQVLPHSRLVVIPGVGHVPHEEDPAAVIAALRDFL